MKLGKWFLFITRIKDVNMHHTLIKGDVSITNTSNAGRSKENCTILFDGLKSVRKASR